MAPENITIVKAVLDAWNRRDLDAILAATHPDVEYVNAPEAVESGTRNGHEGLTVVMRAQWEIMNGQWGIDAFHDRGEEIISEGRVSRTMPGSSAQISNKALISWRFLDGKITGIEILGAGSSFDEASEAAGLRR